MPEDTATQITGRPEDHTSEAEEMYLLTVAVAEEEGHDGPLPVGGLAERLGVSGASANEMIRKLERRSLVAYEPYRGVLLTDRGRAVAHRVLRIRRLWGAFLTGNLGMAADDADALACKLEHVTPEPVGDLLDGLLGAPVPGSEGRPIPGRPETPPEAVGLAEAPIGCELVVRTVAPAAAGFLERHGVEPGVRITILARGERGVLVAGPASVDLAAEVAAAVQVEVPDGG